MILTLNETTEVSPNDVSTTEGAASTDAGQFQEDHGNAHAHRSPLNPDLTREVSVEAEADDVAKSFRNVVKRYQKLARIPGFRSGKIPESLVRSKFSKEVRQEVLEGLVGEKFRKTLEEQNLQPVSEPQVTDLLLQDGQPLRFKATFEVRPEFTLEGYETVSVQRPDVVLSDAEYKAELDRVLDNYSTVQAVEEDRELADGDWAEIEFKGQLKELAQTVTADGISGETAAEPIIGEDILLEIGGSNTLPAFNDALRGTKPGQELQFEVVYPSDFGEPRLAGQTVAYDVKVKAIKSKTAPERDEELAKKLGPYENFEAFETKLREMAEQRKKEALEGRAKDQMLEAFIERYPFPVPESFVQQQIEARLDRGLRALAQQGMQPDEMRKLDFATLREAQRGQAINEVKASMILDRLAQAEQIEISDEELDRELLLLSLQSREPLETLRDRLTKDGSLERIREQMRREKTGTAVYQKLVS